MSWKETWRQARAGALRFNEKTGRFEVFMPVALDSRDARHLTTSAILLNNALAAARKGAG